MPDEFSDLLGTVSTPAEQWAASEKSMPQLQQTPTNLARVCQQSEANTPAEVGVFVFSFDITDFDPVQIQQLGCHPRLRSCSPESLGR